MEIRFYTRKIAGGFVILIGVMLAVLIVRTLLHDIPLWFFGRRVPATVEEIWWENLTWENLSADYYNLEYYLSYRFTTSDGDIIHGASRVTEAETLAYTPGSEVLVKYSPFNPSNNRLDDSRFVPFLICTYLPFILFCLFSLAAGREMIDF